MSKYNIWLDEERFMGAAGEERLVTELACLLATGAPSCASGN